MFVPVLHGIANPVDLVRTKTWEAGQAEDGGAPVFGLGILSLS